MLAAWTVTWPHHVGRLDYLPDPPRQTPELPPDPIMPAGPTDVGWPASNTRPRRVWPPRVPPGYPLRVPGHPPASMPPSTVTATTRTPPLPRAVTAIEHPHRLGTKASRHPRRSSGGRCPPLSRCPAPVLEERLPPLLPPLLVSS
jgi:hypothetical protein